MALTENDIKARRMLNAEQLQTLDISRIAEALEDAVAILQKIHGELFQIARRK